MTSMAAPTELPGPAKGRVVARGTILRGGGWPVAWHRARIPAPRLPDDAVWNRAWVGSNLRLIVEIMDAVQARAWSPRIDQAAIALLRASIAAPATGGAGGGIEDEELGYRLDALCAQFAFERSPAPPAAGALLQRIAGGARPPSAA
jgi:hypothetical protein